MFHQAKLRLKDTDVLRSLWRANPQNDINDYEHSSCCISWALPKTSPNNLPDVNRVIERNFNMDNFLKSLWTCFFYCTYFDMCKLWKITFSVIIFLVWMFVRKEFAIYYIFLLDIHCTTFYIENRSVKRANSHFTICS